MKRKTKLALGGISLLFGAVVLSGCTASFCTVTDQAHMLYAFDYGVTDYKASGTEGYDETVVAYIGGKASGKVELANIKYKAYPLDDATARKEIYEYCSTYKSIDETATKNKISLPSIDFLVTLDSVVLGHALESAGYTVETAKDLKVEQIVRDYKNNPKGEKGVLDNYGYLKYEDSKNEKKVLWTNYYTYIDEVKEIIGIDKCPSTDYIKTYKSSLDGSISGLRSCLATESGEYGAYGPRQIPVEISKKEWTSWNGLLEFILVWPIGALIDVLATNFLSFMASGWAQVGAIFVVTVLIRAIMMVFTIKQSTSSAKMNELQPEIQKIQAKYPNSNTNQYDKQRMAAEMQKLYKKHHINPLMSLLVMFVQFPVFICVWGAMQGSSMLSSGQILGLRLSDPIGTTMFNASNWGNGAAVTALILFLLMSIAQAISMLLPQWIQKKKAKQVAKLGKNPAQTQQSNRMKWFTWIMLAMIIFMGFSLASGMGVYWLFGALFSIAQTLITQAITSRKSKKAKYAGKNETVTGKKKGK